MQVVILAGGYGTRLSEETVVRPKPLVEIGKYPILWHIMKIYATQGYNEFIVCLGYKGELIRDFFAGLVLKSSDFTVDLKTNSVDILHRSSEDWKVTLVDTGQDTLTGGRIRRVASLLKGPAFLMTYGDGLADINLQELIAFHREKGARATVTAVRPPPRYGSINIDASDRVTSYLEKPAGDNSWINGGFFVLQRTVIDLIEGDDTAFELTTLQKLSESGELFAYRHSGFWRSMDTMSDKRLLNQLWDTGSAAWKIWKD